MELKELKNILVNLYKQDFENTSSFAVTYKTSSIAIRLAMEDSDLISNKFQHSSLGNSLGMLGSFEDIRRKKELVDPAELSSMSKKSLVLGRAGIGKSTFSRYAVYRWATGKFWIDAKVLIYLPLGEFKDGESIIFYFLRYYNFEFSEEDILKFIESAFFILDGYDEVCCMEHFKKELKKIDRYVLTSRPTGFGNRFNFDDIETGRHYEILGLGKAGVADYIDIYARQEEKNINIERLKKTIESNFNLSGFARIPNVLNILCYFWVHGTTKDLDESSLITITEFHKETAKLILKKNNINPDDAIYKLLGKIALDGLNAGYGKLNRENVDKILKQSGYFPENIGVLIGGNSHEDGYSFVHHSFQDFFAANYLVKNFSGEELFEFVKENKLLPYYQNIFIFLAGILKDEDCNLYFETLLKEPIDMVGFYQNTLEIKCLEEAKGNIKPLEKNKILDKFKYYIKYGLYDKENKLAVLDKCADLLRFCTFVYNEVKDVFLDALDEKDNAVVRFASIKALGRIGRANKELVDYLLKTLEDEYNPWVRFVYMETFGKFRKTDKRILSILEDSIDIDHKSVIWEASAKALGQICFSDHRMLDTLIDNLSLENDLARQFAAIALGQVGKPDDIVIDSLMNVVESDNNCLVRQAAAEALGDLHISNDIAIEVVIDALLEVLKNDNGKWVRKAAVTSLGKYCRLDSRIVDTLVETVQTDIDAWVRFAAAKVLGKVAFSGFIVHVLLKVAMSTEKTFVRQEAVKSIGRIGKSDDDVVDKLLQIIETDDEETVIQASIMALGYTGTKKLNATNKLKEILNDENIQFAVKAANALCILGLFHETDMIGLLVRRISNTHVIEFLGSSTLSSALEAFKMTEDIETVKFAFYKAVFEPLPVYKVGGDIYSANGLNQNVVSFTEEKATVVEWLLKELRIA